MAAWYNTSRVSTFKFRLTFFTTVFVSSIFSASPSSRSRCGNANCPRAGHHTVNHDRGPSYFTGGHCKSGPLQTSEELGKVSQPEDRGGTQGHQSIDSDMSKSGVEEKEGYGTCSGVESLQSSDNEEKGQESDGSEILEGNGVQGGRSDSLGVHEGREETLGSVVTLSSGEEGTSIRFQVGEWEHSMTGNAVQEGEGGMRDEGRPESQPLVTPTTLLSIAESLAPPLVPSPSAGYRFPVPLTSPAEVVVHAPSPEKIPTALKEPSSGPLPQREIQEGSTGRKPSCHHPP